MPKVASAFAAAALALVVPAAAHAVVLGPEPAACAAGADHPAILVKVIGLKSRAGIVRVQAYDDPPRFFEKGAYIRRIDVRPPMSDPFEVCVPVTHAGTYAISVRHDVSGDGKVGMADGGGFSGNPTISLGDALMRRKPPAPEVAVRVAAAVTTVPVVMKYVSGFALKPVTASR